MGSEMCIRDSYAPNPYDGGGHAPPPPHGGGQFGDEAPVTGALVDLSLLSIV